MKRATDKETTAPGDPWVTALRLLTRRDYSSADLRQRLQQKGFNEATVDAIVTRCFKLGYLDDTRYARNRARNLISQGRAVGRRILLDLRQHGISTEDAEQALAEVMTEFDEVALLDGLLASRFPEFDYSTATQTERRRVVHFLQRRGFPLDQIMKTMTQKGL
jgi:regulatory protein